MKKISTKFQKNTLMRDDYMLPHMTISHKSLPESKKWENGKTYDLHVKVKQTGSTEHDNSYKVTHVASHESKKPKKEKRVLLAKKY